MTDCLFCKIIAREIPSQGVYEDETVYAFLDIHPVNPGHVLVVPKKHSEGVHDADPETLKTLIVATQKVSQALLDSGICEAFNLEVNNGKIAGQLIPHLHFHLIPRRADDGLRPWPGQVYAEGEDSKIAERVRMAIE